MKKIIYFLLIISILMPLGDAVAKKKKDKNLSENSRIKTLQGEDLEMYKSLTKKQQQDIANQEIKPGYNAWMARLALGEPYYTSEHHPIYKDYEEVWLYTKPKVDERITEKKIIDAKTNWPTLYRHTWKKTCTIGDFFLLYDRGVIDKIVEDKSGKTYGSCVVETQEEYIPLKK